jgi:type I restriction-modification system DNA methylase subunit
VETVGVILKELLDTYGYSPVGLANELGVSTSAVSRWLTGGTKPRPLVEGKVREIYARHRQNLSHLSESLAMYHLSTQVDEAYLGQAIDATLIELREALHRYGRLSSRNEALEELSKLLFAHVMTESGISRPAVLGSSRQQNGAARQLTHFVRGVFQKHLPKSLGHEMSLDDFDVKLKPQEDVLALEIISVFEQLAGKCSARGITDLKGVDVLNDVFGKFLADSFANEKQLGQYLTPTEVVRFMVGLAIKDMSEDELSKLCDPKRCEKYGLILDPSCGVGSFLTETLRKLYVEVSKSHSKASLESWVECMVSRVLVGIDKSERMIRLALTNMATFGLPAAQLHLANSLARSGADLEITAPLDGRVSLILTNPPFGAEYRGDDLNGYRIADLGRDAQPAKVNSEVLFVERYIDWLAPGGQFLAIVPDSILTNKGIYETLRKKLADQIEIRSVVSLPVVTFGAAGTNTKTSILHVRKHKKGTPRRKTFFAECHNIGYNVRTKNTQRTKTSNGDGEGDLPKILQAYGLPASNSESIRIVRNVERSARWDVNYHTSLPLAVARRVQSPSESDVYLSDIASLVNDRTDPRRWGTGTFRYIEISDIDSETCTARTQVVPCKDAPSRARKLVEPGDVLFSTVRPDRRTVGVVQESQDGAVCSTGLAVLRPKAVPPLVLAHLLKTDLAINQIMRNTLGIAYPAIDEQCLLDVLLPIRKSGLPILKPLADTLLQIEKRASEARGVLDTAVMDAIRGWELPSGETER